MIRVKEESEKVGLKFNIKKSKIVALGPLTSWQREGKTTRGFRYDLNQMSYHYTVEVTNRFKGLDLTEC